MGKRRSVVIAELSAEPVAVATGRATPLARTTTHRWQRVSGPLNHGWLPAADARRLGLCPEGGARMIEFMQQLAAHARREEGQAMVEYALILGLVSVVAIGALTAIGGDVNGVLGAVEAALAAVPGA